MSVLNSENIVVVSHRRSGTHLTIDAIQNNFPIYKKESEKIGDLTLERLHQKHKYSITIEQLRDEYNSGFNIFKAHFNPDLNYFDDSDKRNLIAEIFENSKIIYVYRDGRDVLKSLFTYIKTYNKEYNDITFSEFLRMDNNFDAEGYVGVMNRVQYWEYHVKGWLAKENILAVSFEDFKYRYADTIKTIENYLGREAEKNIVQVVRKPMPKYIPSTRLTEKLFKIIKKTLFNTDYSSVSFSKGEVGGYKSIYSEEDIEYFNQIAGPLLRDLDYEVR